MAIGKFRTFFAEQNIYFYSSFSEIIVKTINNESFKYGVEVASFVRDLKARVKV
jgi:hypothetical protein